MGLTAATRTPGWTDAGTETGQLLRLNHSSVMLSALDSGAGTTLAVGSGVRDAPGNPLQVAVTAGLSVSVNTGVCAIQGSSGSNAGAYTATLDTVATLTCNAADPVNARIDSVCVTVTDNGTSPGGVVQIVTGTPASAPSAPSLPANSLLLCNITIAAASTTLISANLSDVRQFLAGAGGIKPYLKSALWPTSGSSSMYLHDIATGRMKRYTTAGPIAPSVVGFAPVNLGPATVAASTTAYDTILSSPITVDGATTVKCTLTWEFINTSGAAPGQGCNVALLRGASALVAVQKYAYASGSPIDGGTAVFFDSAPAAGTYTYAVSIKTLGTGTFTIENAYATWEAQPS